MKLFGEIATDRASLRRNVKSACLATSALGSVLIVAAIMQTSAAIAACPQLSALPFTGGNDNLTASANETCVPGKTIDMQAGDDKLTINNDLGFNNALKVDGGSGFDTLVINAGKTVTVGKLFSIVNTEAVDNFGTIDGNKGLNHDIDSGLFTNKSTGVIDVSGGDLNVTGNTSLQFFNDGTITVTGQKATFDGSGNVGSVFFNGGTLTVDQLLTVDGFGQFAVTTGGIINANGGLTYTGTDSADTFDNFGTGAINVEGGVLSVSMGLGNDVFRTAASSTITVTGQNASFDGGAGANTFTNDGDISTVTSGDITISNFQTVTNSGTSIHAAGDFTYNGTSAIDSFTNTGEVTAGGNGAFLMGGNNDTLTNSGATSLIDFAGTGMFDGGGGAADVLTNQGTITVDGLTTVQGFEAVSNSGTINANDGLTYTGTAVVDNFTNLASGAINVSGGALSVNTGNNNDVFTTVAGSTITVTGQNATFDGGAGTADVLNNGGTITVGGLTTIRNFESVFNTGTLNANGGLTYTGSGGVDSFSNTGTVAVTGTGNFSFGVGADTLTNTNAMTATSFIFDGGADADALLNTGLISAGSVSISAFETVTNSANLTATGALTYTGTAGVDTFSNTGTTTVGGNAALDFAADNDSMVNSGTFNVTGTTLIDGGAGTDSLSNTSAMNFGGLATIQGFETVTNSGTMAFNANGTMPAGSTVANIVAGTFTNSAAGVIDLQQGVLGDKIEITGNADLPGTLLLDIRLSDGGVADSVEVAGDVSGAVQLGLNFNDTANYILFASGRLDLVTSTNGGDTSLLSLAVPADGTLLFSSGLVDYVLTKDATGIYVASVLDSDAIGGLAGSFAGAITSVNAMFQKPISSFVSTCKSTEPDSNGFGTWARATTGTIKSNSDSSYTFLGTAQSAKAKNKTDYTGLQGGFDAAACNMDGKNTVHAGLTVGHVQGDSVQTNAITFRSLDFNSMFVGAYAALISKLDSGDSFTADANIRYDMLNYKLTDGTLGLDGTKVDGSTFSGSVGAAYNFVLDDSVVIRPAAGLAVSKTSVDSFDITGGSFSFQDQVSIMGQAALTATKTFTVSDSSYLQPFVSGSVFHEFGNKARSSVVAGGEAFDIDTTTLGTFAQVGGGLTFIVQGGEAASEPNFASTIRFDAQIGEKLEGWALTGQARLQF